MPRLRVRLATILQWVACVALLLVCFRSLSGGLFDYLPAAVFTFLLAIILGFLMLMLQAFRKR